MVAGQEIRFRMPGSMKIVLRVVLLAVSGNGPLSSQEDDDGGLVFWTAPMIAATAR